MSLLRLTKGVLFIFFVINLPFFTIFTGRFISGSCLGLRSDETDLFKVVLAHTDTIKVSIFFGMHAVYVSFYLILKILMSSHCCIELGFCLRCPDQYTSERFEIDTF